MLVSFAAMLNQQEDNYFFYFFCCWHSNIWLSRCLCKHQRPLHALMIPSHHAILIKTMPCPAILARFSVTLTLSLFHTCGWVAE